MNSSSCWVLLFFLVRLNQINATFLNRTQESSRIVGGTFTSIGNAKFVVYLRDKGKFICGGSLVTPKVVVTAAHCVEGIKAADLIVVAGATYLSDRGIRSKVSKVLVPKEYNAQTFDKDIAVLQLAKNLKGLNISSIDLCHTMCKANDVITVYGWGRISETNSKSSNQLRSVSVPVIGQSTCRNMYKNEGKLTEAMFCAGDLRGKDACTGDSGGPAIYRNQLCGVVSWGVGCARKEYPGVYTNIKSVRNFIVKAMSHMGNKLLK